MNTRLQKLCAYCGVPAIALFFLGLIVAQFLPVPAPSMSADDVATMYSENTALIRTGAVLILLSTMFTAPFFAAISVQLRQMEGDSRPVMAYTQLAAGAMNIAFFILPALLLIVTAFRPDRPPEITQALNDLSWIVAILPWPLAALQALAVTFTVFVHHEHRPILPRWLGYFSLWFAILLVPASLIPYFKTGPFAWNGIIAFWIPASLFGLWYPVMQQQLIRAIKAEANQV